MLDHIALYIGTDIYDCSTNPYKPSIHTIMQEEVGNVYRLRILAFGLPYVS
jgi:hypothetical protein